MSQATSSRSQQLAAQLEAVAGEFATLVGSLSPAEWATPGRNSPDWQLGEDEHRPVGTIAHHVAAIIGVPHLAMIRDAAEGRPLELVQGWTVEVVAAGNAQFAQQHAKVTKAQALELLKANTARALELLGGPSLPVLLDTE